jgi:hypothetical protein
VVHTHTYLYIYTHEVFGFVKIVGSYGFERRRHHFDNKWGGLVGGFEAEEGPCPAT